MHPHWYVGNTGNEYNVSFNFAQLHISKNSVKAIHYSMFSKFLLVFSRLACHSAQWGKCKGKSNEGKVCVCVSEAGGDGMRQGQRRRIVEMKMSTNFPPFIIFMNQLDIYRCLKHIRACEVFISARKSVHYAFIQPLQHCIYDSMSLNCYILVARHLFVILNTIVHRIYCSTLPSFLSPNKQQ